MWNNLWSVSRYVMGPLSGRWRRSGNDQQCLAAPIWKYRSGFGDHRFTFFIDLRPNYTFYTNLTNIVHWVVAYRDVAHLVRFNLGKSWEKSAKSFDAGLIHWHRVSHPCTSELGSVLVRTMAARLFSATPLLEPMHISLKRMRLEMSSARCRSFWLCADSLTPSDALRKILVNDDSDNGLLPDSTKPLPEVIFTWKYWHPSRCHFIEKTQDMLAKNIIYNNFRSLYASECNSKCRF